MLQTTAFGSSPLAYPYSIFMGIRDSSLVESCKTYLAYVESIVHDGTVYSANCDYPDVDLFIALEETGWEHLGSLPPSDILVEFDLDSTVYTFKKNNITVYLGYSVFTNGTYYKTFYAVS